MKITRFSLEAFGPFTDRELDFDAPTPGMHVIYGPNEAGKSSMLRALIAWLYGFPERTADNFRHANNRLQVSGVLEDSRGQELFFRRRKKRKGSALDAHGEPMDSNLVRAWLQNLDREAFTTLFGLDHPGLVQGGAEILEGKGSAGTTLFSAGTGIASVQEILNTLYAESQEIFKPKGSKPELNAAVSQYRALQKEMNTLSFTSRQWRELERDYRQAEEELRAFREKRAQWQSEYQRLTRLEKALEPLAALRQATDKLEGLRQIPPLPEDFSDRRRNSQERLRRAEQTLAEAGKRLEEDQARAAGIAVNTELLDQARTIENLHQRLGAFRNGQTDRRDLEREQEKEKAAATAVLRRIRPDLDLEKAQSLRPMLQQRRTIDGHGKKLELLDKECRDSHEVVNTKQAELERTQAELQALPLDRDLTSLRRAVEDAVELGNIDKELENKQAEAGKQERDLAAALARLGHWTGTPTELLALPLPLEGTVRRMKKEWESLEHDDDEVAKAVSEVDAKTAELERDIRAHELAGDVPTEADLEIKRQWRDQGWHLLRRRWLQGHDVEAEALEYAPEENLPDAYEQAVRTADEAADRLRRESSRVHEYARLQAELQTVHKRRVQLQQAADDVQSKWKNLASRWNEVWEPCGMTPASPEEMAGWLGELTQWRIKAQQIVDVQKELNDLAGKRETARRALLQALQDAGEQTVPGLETLAPVVRAAQAVIQNLEETKNKRQTLEQTVTRLEQELTQARERAQTADDALAGWRRQWRAYLERLGLADNESPDSVSDFFQDLESCLRHLETAESYARRIQGIDAQAWELEQDVVSLSRRVAPELVELPVDQAVERLNGLLHRATEDTTKLTTYQDAIAATEEELRKARSQRDKAMIELSDLCQTAGCTDQSELETVERQWRQRRELEDIVATQEDTLRRIAEPGSIDDLAADVDQTDRDALPGRLQECSEELERLNQRIEEQSQKVGNLETKFREVDGRPAAARKAEEAEEKLAQIRRLAERYTRLQVAAKVLADEIERYRAENQDPVLSLASGYFSEVTMDSFCGLRVDIEDKGGQVIVGVRGDGQWVPVEGMSDGTRDQLYLSLRLASLEYRLEKSDPLPFIVDDILINFDEDRTRAALKALARLGTKNQVLVFTHHRQVADAAAELGIGHVHRLEGKV